MVARDRHQPRTKLHLVAVDQPSLLSSSSFLVGLETLTLSRAWIKWFIRSTPSSPQKILQPHMSRLQAHSNNECVRQSYKLMSEQRFRDSSAPYADKYVREMCREWCELTALTLAPFLLGLTLTSPPAVAFFQHTEQLNGQRVGFCHGGPGSYQDGTSQLCLDDRTLPVPLSIHRRPLASVSCQLAQRDDKTTKGINCLLWCFNPHPALLPHVPELYPTCSLRLKYVKKKKKN